ncbi:phage holin family protein [Paucisalibacillus sp. EB02]|uniref:phage holin family protein n=1 Tax=Paucisalibacillus sp. EB02 TaxID=1347087 RepID=UPI0004AED2CA|nr:phage holin family protein [Paucisalibacillus sp. EB02]
MPLWLFLLIIFGGLLVVGLIFDWVAKKRNIKTDFQEGIKNASESERIYTEKALDDVRHKIGNDTNNW